MQMYRYWTTSLGEHVGQRVRLAGWLHHQRMLRNLTFLILRDSQGTAQIVIDEPEAMRKLASLPHESVIEVSGTVTVEPQAPGGVEMRDAVVKVVSEALEPPPFDLFRPAIKAQLPTVLDYAAVSLRHPRSRALFRIGAAAVAGFRAALQARNFVEIFTPKLVGTSTESGANVFPVNYFGRPAYLAQSPQFYKQIMVGVFERVFEVGPVFRAEPHDTPRHINEYVSLDVELGFIRDHTDVMALARDVMAAMVDQVWLAAASQAQLVHANLPDVPAVIPSLHFVEAQELLYHETGEDARGEPDLAPTHERWLGEWARRTSGSEFLFIVGYPMVKRPFYTHPDPAQPRYSNSFDLLFRGMEVMTGGQRLHRYEDYLQALAVLGQNPAPLAGYLEAFKHGMPPHGGFAIGLERWVARLADIANIRETALFPRDIQRLTP